MWFLQNNQCRSDIDRYKNVVGTLMEDNYANVQHPQFRRQLANACVTCYTRHSHLRAFPTSWLLLRLLCRRDTLTSVTGTRASSIIDVWHRAMKIRITIGNSARAEPRSQFRTIREMFAVALQPHCRHVAWKKSDRIRWIKWNDAFTGSRTSDRQV